MLRMNINAGAALCVAVLLGGCAATGAGAPAAMDAAADRGQQFAQLRCSGCHAVSLDETPGASGPRFRDLRLRYTPLSLTERFRAISAHGSGEMPPLQISPSEAEDLVAYIESLG